MFSLSQTTGYALAILANLEDPGGRFVPLTPLATRFGIPEPYLRKVATRLVSLGLIASRRGIDGGMVLRRPAGTITLQEVAEQMEPPGWDRRCLLGLPACSESAGASPTHPRLESNRRAILETLRSLTLRDLSAYWGLPHDALPALAPERAAS